MSARAAGHEQLNHADHGGLGVHMGAGAQYGDAVMAALAVPNEFRRLATEYPILFRRDPAGGGYSALALFGFEAGENLFLDGDRWDAATRPMAIMVRPFLIGRPREGDTPAQVHIDRAHPRVAEDGSGTPLFDAAGRPTPMVAEIARLLGDLDEGYRASDGFFAALTRYDLIEPFSMDVALANGGQQRLVGYSLIDEDRVRALEPAALAELHTAGYLMPMFMALASLGNIAKLVRRREARGRG